MSWNSALKAGLVGFGVLAAFSPVAPLSGGGAARAGAVCATCCPQEGATCVVCGTSDCAKVKDAYEGKIGPGGCILDS